MSATTTARITSKDLVIQFLPCGVAATHVQKLYFQADLTGGTFKLRVNGELTAAITFDATEATLITNVDAALDALPNLSAAEIALTGTDIEDMTLTASGNGWYTIDIVDIGSLTGNSGADPNLTTEVTTQGSELYTLSTNISAFNWEQTVETVDVTAISEYERTEIPVAEAVAFDMSIYKATDITWKHAVHAGVSGTLYVYPQGKIVGKDYLAFTALFENYSEDYPDHEKVEISASGMRQGAWVTPPHSVYRG